MSGTVKEAVNLMEILPEKEQDLLKETTVSHNDINWN